MQPHHLKLLGAAAPKYSLNLSAPCKEMLPNFSNLTLNNSVLTFYVLICKSYTSVVYTVFKLAFQIFNQSKCLEQPGNAHCAGKYLHTTPY